MRGFLRRSRTEPCNENSSIYFLYPFAAALLPLSSACPYEVDTNQGGEQRLPLLRELYIVGCALYFLAHLYGCPQAQTAPMCRLSTGTCVPVDMPPNFPVTVRKRPGDFAISIAFQRFRADSRDLPRRLAASCSQAWQGRIRHLLRSFARSQSSSQGTSAPPFSRQIAPFRRPSEEG